MVDNPAPNEGSSENQGNSRRRRRRGNRRPDDRPAADGSSTPAPQSPDNTARESSAQPSSEGGEQSAERRGRNRRRRGRGERGERTDRPERPELPEGAEAGADSPEGSETPSAAEPQRQDQRQEQRRDRGRRGGRGEKKDDRRDDRKDDKKEEKKERAPRGSVLQRRSTRGSVDLDAALAKDAAEEPSAPAPIATDVDSYIRNLKGWQREVVTILRGIVRNQAREAEESILWSQPVYTINGPVCYIKAFTDHVNFGFWRGNEIDDPEDLLIGELPTMRHVTIRHINEVNRDAYEGLVRSAVKLNKEKGDPT